MTGLLRRRGDASAVAVLTLVAVLAACSSSGKSASKSTATVTSGRAPGAGVAPPAADSGIPAVVARVSPSVVTILTPQGLGSGVVWSANGVIVTDDHVVTGSTQVTVAFADGRRVGGTVLAGDRTTDLAVVKADRGGLPAATFARSVPPVGGTAIAIGSPLGFANTVSVGVVSGLQRSIPGSAQQGPALANLIQTDAAISPGDSGGGLFNGNGEVIGINEAYLPPSTGAVDLGFATPVSTVQQIVPQLLKNGKAVHPFIGVQVAQLTPDIARQLGVNATDGAIVIAVVAGSPAEKAGLAEGDVITAIDNAPVHTVEDFVGLLRPHQPGDVVTVTIVRGNATRQVKVTLSEQP
jgi:S1-C subfamily serine protease